MKYPVQMFLFFLLFIITIEDNGIAGLLINEISCESSQDDWVEIFFQSDQKEEMDISRLYVTMYYGKSEKLSEYPITLYSYDRPETPYDDRFAVIYFTKTVMVDETDLTGDSNHNGRIDVYCNNYTGSLWNSDGIAAIDTDDDPSNGGIIDFAGYSNRDGSVNETIESYVAYAQKFIQWGGASTGANIQECMVDIGPDGLKAFMSIARKNGADTNTMNDFAITGFQTPGRENILSGDSSKNKRLFSSAKKKISIIPNHPDLGAGDIDLFIYETCNLRLRIFSPVGLLLYESPLYLNVFPGNLKLNWDLKGLHKNACTGLYLCRIDASSPQMKKTDSELIYLILSRYK